MAKVPITPPVPRERRSRGSNELRQQIVDFVFAEGAVAIAKTDPVHYFGSVAGTGRYNKVENPWDVDAPSQPLELVFAVEHYNRIMHILEENMPVEMEIDVKTTVYRGDPNDFNVIAEIPGTDLAHEIVIVGGHLQSLPHGTGAIDNAAGSTTSMEAVRILKAIGARPRRTIRVGLWGGHDGVCRCLGEVARGSPLAAFESHADQIEGEPRGCPGALVKRRPRRRHEL
jgi:hypothetical protein